MEVIKISPRGYCYGVVDAMVLAQHAADNKELPRPIYILGMIVHNQHVVEAFQQMNVHTLDGADRLALLDQIDKGTVIFTAHGVSPQVRAKALSKGLTVIDATCPDVTKTHDLIRDKVEDGYEIVYVGKKGHPEPEGAVGIAPGRVHLIETFADIENLQLNTDKIIITNQTTMSQWDTAELMQAVLKRYPTAEVHNEICMATQVRQQAVAEQAKEADVCIVVGDPRSNNSNRLAQVAEEIAGVPAYRISSIEDIKPEWFAHAHKVAVTSGASTPTPITKQVIDYLEQFEYDCPKTWDFSSYSRPKRILPGLKS
jgi:4-hydroxy-3-methylbut-2-enyl diphosphate reductase